MLDSPTGSLEVVNGAVGVNRAEVVNKPGGSEKGGEGESLVPEIVAAEKLEEKVNQGTNPEDVMRNFAEGNNDSDENPNPQENKGTNSQEQQLNNLIAEYENGKITVDQLLQGYQKIFGLEAPNLEEDERHKNLTEIKLSQWEELHPKPHEGKEYSELTDRQIDEIRNWMNERYSYRETKLPSKIDAEFQREYPDDYDRYKRLGIYYETYYVDIDKKVIEIRPSLRADPVWKEMEKQATERVNRRVAQLASDEVHKGIESWFLDQSIETDNALITFCRKYPEKAVIYALFDSQVAIALTKVNEGQQKREASSVTKGSGDTDSKAGERLEKSRDELGGGKEGSDGDGKENEVAPPEGLEQSIRELREEVLSLKEENAYLRNKLDILEKSLTGLNTLAEELLKSQGRLPENYEQGKKENPILAFLVLLILLTPAAIKKAQEK